MHVRARSHLHIRVGLVVRVLPIQLVVWLGGLVGRRVSRQVSTGVLEWATKWQGILWGSIAISGNASWSCSRGLGDRNRRDCKCRNGHGSGSHRRSDDGNRSNWDSGSNWGNWNDWGDWDKRSDWGNWVDGLDQRTGSPGMVGFGGRPRMNVSFRFWDVLMQECFNLLRLRHHFQGSRDVWSRHHFQPTVCLSPVRVNRPLRNLSTLEKRDRSVDLKIVATLDYLITGTCFLGVVLAIKRTKNLFDLGKGK